MRDLLNGEFNRRHFLQASALAGLGMAGLPAWASAEEKKDDAFGGFTLGIQSYTFREFEREPCLKRTQDLGLHYIEFYEKHLSPKAKPAEIKAVLKQCGDYGIKPIAFGVQRFTKSDEENKKLFEFGKQLGITTFSADPDPDSFDSLDKMCEEYKIAIGIHPHGPVSKDRLHRWHSAENILKAVKDHNPLIGTCLDTGHLIRSAVPPFNLQLDPAQQVREMGARNFGMHLKDHDNKMDTDVVYGKGVLDVASVLKSLKDVKFKGYISIEYEAHPDDPMPDVKACVEVFKETVKKLT
jgi:inosose dehydratase